ncbi:hypothetical protein BC936DRAFT_141197, partial [Jimgerdemannia flammicorona]
MSVTQNLTLWLCFEEKPRSFQFPVQYKQNPPNLDALAAILSERGRLKTVNLDAFDIEFFHDDNHSESLPGGILVTDLTTTDISPLFLRYPFSGDRVLVRYHLSNSKGSTLLNHNTGMWYCLRQKVYKYFEVLQDGDPEFYFVPHLGEGKDGFDIEDAFMLNSIVSEAPVNDGKREISLVISIKGKKAYVEYTFKEVSKIFAKEEWNNLANAPKFDIGSLSEPPLQPSEEEFKAFVDQLKQKNQVFCGDIPNDATAREFISIFMTTAIFMIQCHMKETDQNFTIDDLRLLVEEILSGTRGFGLVDYLVKYLQLVVMVNEAKHRDFEQGAAQNIVQMHSALEKLNKKRRLN